MGNPNILKIMLLAFVIIANSAVFSQESDTASDGYYEISNIYHLQARKMTCEFVKKKIEEIKLKKDSEIQSEIELEIDSIQTAIESSESEDEKEVLKDLENNLILAKEKKNPREKLITGLETLCRVARFPLRIGSRAVAITNTSIINLLALPFSSVYNFFSGLLGRRDKKELGARTDILYRVLGPKKGISTYLIGSIAYQAPELMFKINPAIMVLNASIAVEMITNYQCLNANPTDSSRLKFCKVYNKIKDFYHRGNQASFKVGKKLQELIDEKVFTKRENFDPVQYCNLKKSKQVKRLKNTLFRYNYFQEDKKVYAAGIILPIHKNECTKLLIQAENEENLQALKKERTHLEGIEVVYLLKDTYPGKYFFTQEELSEMPLKERICHDVVKSHYNGMSYKKSELFGSYFKSMLASSMLGVPESHQVIMDDSMIRQGKIKNLRNVIFSIGPSYKSRTAVEDLLDEKEAIIKKVKKTYKKLMKHDTMLSCKEFIEEEQIDLVDLKKDFARIDEIMGDKDIQNYQQLLAVEKFYKKSKRKLKLSWEVIPTNNLSEVSKILKSNDIGNVVITSHGRSSGHLIDSFGQEFHKNESFKNLSPSLMSLNFYSCHSKNIEARYRIKEKLKSRESYYKIRYFSHVKENNLFNSDSFAPISAFGDYIYQLDRYLYDGHKGALALQENFGTNFDRPSSPELCEINVADVERKKGSYSIVLNNNLLATLAEYEEGRVFKFPCSVLKEKDNKLYLKNLLNSRASEIENIDTFTIKVGDVILKSNDATVRPNTIRFNFSL